MTRAKINMGDVARFSGVSRATVDRVLNKRPGVRIETVQKVERVLRELGYTRSALHALADPIPVSVTLVVPKGLNPFFRVIHDSVEAALQIEALSQIAATILPFDPYQPATLISALDSVLQGTDTVITIGCDMPEVARAINDLVGRGIRVITMISDVPQSRRIGFVGQDNFAAGRTAARLMAGLVDKEEGFVGVFLGHYHFRHLMDRMAGFRQTLGQLRPDVQIIQPPPYASDPDKAMEAIDEVDRAGRALKGVYITGGGQPVILGALAKLTSCDHDNLVVLGHEVSPQSSAALQDGRFAALLGADMTLIAKRALQAATEPDPALFDPCPINIYFPENLPYA